MGEKEVVTTRKISGELMGGFLIFGILGSLIYSIIYTFIIRNVFKGSLIGAAITSVILQGVIAYFVWKVSTSSAFKKKTIHTSDVPTIMKNLAIFTIILCFITAIINFSDVNSTLEKEVDTNSKLYETFLYTEAEKAQFRMEKEKALAQAKGELYTYFILLEAGLFAVYLGVLPLTKKNILKYTIN